ncbi:MAG: sporulation transcriptional regulator SpoIIID [Clostridia bacterium]|nr:sporulation transcriptional regulator SpoIIID [Clostridia bacterium]MBQ2272118.1 sporulation transcriptional regulator SpoIIID [Clostridia bacterium]MBQ5821312.1 sporulation transcriptional regulator SpoIIID [Clostridia bacterium]
MDELRDRVMSLATYIAENGATVRDAAKQFGVSKSTVHKDVTCRLKEYHGGLYEQVREVLDQNKSERHLRGGLATREKYRLLQKSAANS